MTDEQKLKQAADVLEARIKKYRTERDQLPDRQSSDLKASTLTRRITKLEAAKREVKSEARRIRKEAK